MASREVRRLKEKEGKKKESSGVSHSPLTRFVIIVVLVVVTISFIALPLAYRFSDSGGFRFVFGSYNGKEVFFASNTENYFSLEKDRIARFVENQYGSNIFQDQVSALKYYFQAAFDDTILHMAVLNKAEQSGLWVSLDNVATSLIQFDPYSVINPFINMETRKFDKDLYRSIKTQRRNIYQAYLNIRQQELIHRKFRSDIVESYLAKDNPAELKFIAEMFAKEKRFYFIAFSFEEYPEDRVVQYAEKNQKLFQQASLSRIIVNSSKSEAEKMHQQILEGVTSFQAMAENSDDDVYKSRGGKMGNQYYHDLLLFFNQKSEPVDAIFTLTKDELSPVFEIETEGFKQWVFFKLDSIIIPPDLSDENFITTIKSYLQTSDKSELAKYIQEQAAVFKKRADEIGFVSASIEAGKFPLKETDYFPINYDDLLKEKTITGAGTELLAGITSEERFLFSIFSLPESGTSEPYFYHDNYVIFSPIDERQISEDQKEAVMNKVAKIKEDSINMDFATLIVDLSKKVDRVEKAIQEYLDFWKKAGSK